ncbi:exopolysaccharide biosynthesis polyprenyl glycosylphosphotransferase [Acidisphaera sp. S103]|uniref:exopolysaccharide biosynthesis polyprenyl glycosylphosphotransferase n=1 Tax=Acidisphaera sp. S103 TaxID=1747223 RepID=UPI00131E3A8A|nr:exopolysaccharide biosynthesis polyprenyl glycosylphosphotransferase [Acidisphaera sp. S103]
MLISPPSLDRQPRAEQHKISLIRLTYGLINRTILVSDALLVVLASWLFWRITAGDHRPLHAFQALTIGFIIAVSYAWLMRWGGCYRVERFREWVRPQADMLCGLVPATVGACIILQAFVVNAWDRVDWFGGFFLTIMIMLFLGRQIYRPILWYVARRHLLRRRVIVVGSGALADEIVAHIQEPKFLQDYLLLEVFDHHLALTESGDGSSARPSNKLDDLFEFAQNHAVDLVIIALPWYAARDIFRLIQRLQWIAADVVVPFARTGFRPQFTPPVEFIDRPLLQVMHRPFKGSQGLIKVMEDYVVAAVALLLASPILLAAALAVWITDGRPVFFHQQRVGFNNKPFSMIKFRTMSIDNTDDGSLGTKRENQRITPVGRFLRRTSIDELPQLINVLRGEMAIVGPRPHVANMQVGEGRYAEVVMQYAARHRIKPGITGWAQINGMRGGIDSLEKAKRGADLDLFYIANWSLRFDLTIMIRTLLVGLAGRNVF